MANDSLCSTLEFTLEDSAWKDSFDKLLEPRPVLRELNILKRDIRVSFNMNSSVENGPDDSCSNLLVPPPQNTKGNAKASGATKRHELISTPVVDKMKSNPFKCSLSPICSWKFHFLNKDELAVHEQEFHATPVNPAITVVDYNSEDPTSNEAPASRGLSPSILPLPLRKTKSQKKKRTRSQRHVCFESAIENLTTRKSSKNTERPKSAQHCAQLINRSSIVGLQPGKWRKSLSIWRRNYVQDVRSSSKFYLNAANDSSVEFVAATVIAGARRSIFLKTERQSDVSSEQTVLQRCQQVKPLPFEQVYPAERMLNSRKIGEGAYGEVFFTSSRDPTDAVVFKIIPIEGHLEINGEVQKTYEQILPEIIISMELCKLRSLGNENRTTGFVGIKKASCVQGKYPSHLIKLWEEYDSKVGSENDHPEGFPDDQIYIVLELEFCGRDLESFQFNNAEQAYYVLQQVVLTLAVGEQQFQFEHRDLHWGNVLLLNTKEKNLIFKLEGNELTVPTKGVKATIIDYTLSRMTFDDMCLYNDLASDEDLFNATGDYQFDIYRMMREALRNEWKAFQPRTNVFWISYIIAKMIDGVSYKNTRTKTHAACIVKLKHLRSKALDFGSAVHCAKYLFKL